MRLVSSVDPSSTTMTSLCTPCCPSALSIAAARKLAELYAGMMVDTAFMSISSGSNSRTALLRHTRWDRICSREQLRAKTREQLLQLVTVAPPERERE